MNETGHTNGVSRSTELMKNLNESDLKTVENKIRSEKKFIPRNSLLTELYKNEQFYILRRGFITALIIITMNVIVCEYLANENKTINNIIIGFKQFHKVIGIWITMFGASLLIYPGFYTWAKQRNNLSDTPKILKLWDYVWLFTFIVHLILFLCLVPYLKEKMFALGSVTIILAEQIRMIMKMHAYVRSNVPRILVCEQNSKEKLCFPEFSKFLFFLFVPTFVYQDEYPRTKEIRWKNVAINLSELLAAIWFISFLGGNILNTEIKQFGLKPYTWQTVAALILRNILSGFLIMISLFYIVLHAWMNVGAEVLRFADRLFYADWWNATMYCTYYRNWNFVVHDYLHTYIYKDLYNIVLPGNKIFAGCVVIFISALVHEYMISFLLNLFFPVLFLHFSTFGMWLANVRVKKWKFIGNVFILWSISFGFSMLFVLYSLEYFARINCPKIDDPFWDIITPRLFTCFNNNINV